MREKETTAHLTISMATGETLQTSTLDGTLCFEGLSIAGKSLFAATEQVQVHCLE